MIVSRVTGDEVSTRRLLFAQSGRPMNRNRDDLSYMGRSVEGVCQRVLRVRHGNLQREFILHAPKPYCGINALSQLPPIPLVFALHGYGAPKGMFTSIFSDFVVPLSFVLVQPIGTGRPLSFNGIYCCGQAIEDNIDDIGFLIKIVHSLQTMLPIDPTGVVGTGFSNGAFLLEAAVAAVKIFSTIAPIGGHNYAQNISASGPMPIFLHHSIDDGTVKYEGCCLGRRCCCGISERAPLQCLSVEAIFERWMDINRCSRKDTLRTFVAPRDSEEVSNLLHEEERTRTTSQHARKRLRFIVDEQQTLDEGTRVSAVCTSGIGCVVNTTMCSISNLGHLYPGRRKSIALPVSISPKEILTFLLRGACEANGMGKFFRKGTSESDFSCRCLNQSMSGRYCLRADPLTSFSAPWTR